MLWYYEIVRTPGCSGETETPPEPSFNKAALRRVSSEAFVGAMFAYGAREGQPKVVEGLAKV